MASRGVVWAVHVQGGVSRRLCVVCVTLPGLGIGLVLLILGNVGGCSHRKGLVENQYFLNPGTYLSILS